MNQLRALLKWLLSYRKKTWELRDYPIRIRKQDVARGPSSGRLKTVPWNAQIINWWQLDGCGDTRERAPADLRSHLARCREANGSLPRPGTRVPIQFAPANIINHHVELARDFMARVFNLNYDECFISDESSLWDLHTDETNDDYYRKIMLIYGVDVSTVEGAKLALIFERIANQRRS